MKIRTRPEIPVTLHGGDACFPVTYRAELGLVLAEMISAVQGHGCLTCRDEAEIDKGAARHWPLPHRHLK